MRASDRRILHAALITFASVAACTQDYDEFSLADGASSESSSDPTGSGASDPSGSGASGATGASGGAPAGGGSTGATGGGSGGTPQCGPCEIPNGQPGCEADQCVIAGCDPGFDDCNAMVPDGCETPTDADVANCGACERACSQSSVAVALCAGGVCTSSCALGAANCSKPATGPDDGCELDVTANHTNCGGCGNDCTNQGFGSGFVCQSMTCRCTSNTHCKGGGSGNASCDTVSGTCVCDGTACRPGEACEKVGPSQVCRCNGGSPCSAAHVCCENPAGCKDLMTDAQSCGACGHACAPGQSCVSGVCV